MTETGAVRSARPRRRRRRSACIAILFACAGVMSWRGPVVRAGECETDTLYAEPGESFSRFGTSVSLRGGVAVIGAPFRNVGPLETGAAHVYRDAGLGWTAEATLFASDGEHFDQFGHAVATSGSVIVVGAPLHAVDGVAGAGAAYVYRFDGLAWRPEGILRAPVPGASDAFGWSVGVDGDVAAVGALRDDEAGPDAGAAWVFRYDGHAWTLEQKLLAPDGAGQDRFGWTLALAGDELLIGAPLDDDLGSASGSVRVFRHDGASWSQAQVLTAPDGAAADRFGSSVARAGDVVLVGAPLDDDLGPASGSVAVFRRDGQDWVHEQKLLATAGEAFDNFGWSVATWGAAAAAGAWQDAVNGQTTGTVRVFRLDADGTWSAGRTLLISGAADGDEFGAALALDAGGTLLAAATNGDAPGTAGAGTTAVFDLAACLCVSDVNGSGGVDIQDLLAVLAAWGRAAAADADIAPAFAPDGLIDGADLLMLLQAWGTCP